MEESIVNVQIVQASPAAREIISNTATAERIVRQSGADLVLLPELF